MDLEPAAVSLHAGVQMDPLQLPAVGLIVSYSLGKTAPAKLQGPDRWPPSTATLPFWLAQQLSGLCQKWPQPCPVSTHTASMVRTYKRRTQAINVADLEAALEQYRREEKEALLTAAARAAPKATPPAATALPLTAAEAGVAAEVLLNPLASALAKAKRPAAAGHMRAHADYFVTGPDYLADREAAAAAKASKAASKAGPRLGVNGRRLGCPPGAKNKPEATPAKE